MKIAVIGYGIIGKVHASYASTLGELVAICDISSQKREQAKSDYPAVAVYDDYLNMLSEVKIEVVHICTPHFLHAQMVINALGLGVNVLCEKPLCIKREDIARILEAEKNSTAMLGVCLQNRYNKPNLFVSDLLKDKKAISASGFCFWQREQDYYDLDEWRGKWKTEGGGVLINQALHTLDLVANFVGFPQSVIAQTNNLMHPKIEVEDSAVAFFEGAVPFCFHATTNAVGDYPVGITIKTQDGSISVCEDKVIVNGKVYEMPEDGKINGKVCYGTSHSKLIAHFYDCVKTGEKFPIDGREGAKVVRMILACYESKGNKVSI